MNAPLGAALAIVALSTLEFATAHAGDVILVPEDFTNIQGAVNSVPDFGSATISVAAGTYAEIVVFGDQLLTFEARSSGSPPTVNGFLANETLEVSISNFNVLGSVTIGTTSDGFTVGIVNCQIDGGLVVGSEDTVVSGTSASSMDLTNQFFTGSFLTVENSTCIGDLETNGSGTFTIRDTEVGGMARLWQNDGNVTAERLTVTGELNVRSTDGNASATDCTASQVITDGVCSSSITRCTSTSGGLRASSEFCSASVRDSKSARWITAEAEEPTAPDGVGSTATVENCIANGPVSGRGFTMIARGNTIVGVGVGTGISMIEEVSSSTIERNIVVGFAVGIEPQGTATISCNDVWDCAIRYQNVADPTGSAGNISVDPLFCSGDPDVRIQDTSPCRPGNHPDGVDCGLIGAGSVGCVVDTPEGHVAAAAALMVSNPASGRVRIARSDDRASAELFVFDVAGRAVFRTSIASGVSSVSWDGRGAAGAVIAPGVYFVELREPRGMASTRFVWR